MACREILKQDRRRNGGLVDKRQVKSKSKEKEYAKMEIEKSVENEHREA